MKLILVSIQDPRPQTSAFSTEGSLFFTQHLSNENRKGIILLPKTQHVIVGRSSFCDSWSPKMPVATAESPYWRRSVTEGKSGGKKTCLDWLQIKSPTHNLQYVHVTRWGAPRVLEGAPPRAASQQVLQIPSTATQWTEALDSTPAGLITPPGQLPAEFRGYPRRLLVSCLPVLACGTWEPSPCSGLQPPCLQPGLNLRPSWGRGSPKFISCNP